jgi:hypothetical protein
MVSQLPSRRSYEGTVESEGHADLDYDPVSPGMIGAKWLVVDYYI